MKSLAVVSQKGGVGKTTLALNLSYALSRINLRVVLVDTDPQGAVGHSLTGATESPGLAGVLAGRADVGQALLETRVAEFSILPLGNVPPSEGHDFVARLADGRLLSDLATRFEASHDVVVFDTPSGFGGATLGALYASDHAITPLQAEPVALRTLPQLFSVIGALRERGARVTLSGIVLSMLQQRNSDSPLPRRFGRASLPTSCSKRPFRVTLTCSRPARQACRSGCSAA